MVPFPATVVKMDFGVHFVGNLFVLGFSFELQMLSLYLGSFKRGLLVVPRMCLFFCRSFLNFVQRLEVWLLQLT